MAYYNHTHINVHDWHRTNMLTWHDGVIPHDEIWVKIGGDKGGKSMKGSLQRTKTQLSSEHYCFSIFEASDSLTNLHVALDHYNEQIMQLQSTLWRYNTQ